MTGFGLLAVCALAAAVGGSLAHRIGQPAVVGEVVAGVSLAHLLWPLVTGEALSIIPGSLAYEVASLGLVLFMFVAGHEIDLGSTVMRRAGLRLGLTSALVPGLLGAGVGLWWASSGSTPASDWRVPAFFAVAMAVTALPVLARIIGENHQIPRTHGLIALTAAGVIDGAAWVLLGLQQSLGAVGGVLIPVYLVTVLVVGHVFGRWILARATGAETTLVLVAYVFASAAAAEALGLHLAFGGFFAGVAFPRIKRTDGHSPALARLSQGVFVWPALYFVIAGSQVEIRIDGADQVLLVVLIVLGGIVSKLVGSHLGARLAGIPTGQRATLAVLMNTRGLTEIVILGIGLDLGLLDGTTYTGFVLLALISTGMTQPALSWLARRRRRSRSVQGSTVRPAVGSPPEVEPVSR